MLILSVVLGILAITVGYTVVQNFKLFKQFLSTPTYFVIKELTSHHYFKKILVERWKDTMLEAYGEGFRNHAFHELEPLNQEDFNKLFYNMPIVPWMAGDPELVTAEDRAEMELRSEFLRSSTSNDVLVKREDGNLVDMYSKWKSGRDNTKNFIVAKDGNLS